MNVSIKTSNHLSQELESIAEIEKECFSEPWSINALKEFVSSEYNRILVLYCDAELSGYITYTRILDEVQIANVAVKQSQRRKGFGKALVAMLIEESAISGSHLITLEVRRSNTSAFELYKKCGFKVVGERKNYYTKPTENAILMNYTIP